MCLVICVKIFLAFRFVRQEHWILASVTNTQGNLDFRMMEMGIAVVEPNACIAFWGIQCDACYRACPLLNEAITLQYDRNERTGKHAFLKPVINMNICTGCGLCEQACVTAEAGYFYST